MIEHTTKKMASMPMEERNPLIMMQNTPMLIMAKPSMLIKGLRVERGRKRVKAACPRFSPTSLPSMVRPPSTSAPTPVVAAVNEKPE